MNISLSWLKKYIALEESAEKIAEYLTETGLEVEGIETFEQIKGGLEGFVVGEVLTCEPHPNSDHLNCTTVDIGAEEVLSIVCGASNVAKGQKVIVATIRTTLYPLKDGQQGEPFQIKKSKIRGEVSEGMICAEDEMGLGKGHDGILVLEGEKAQAKNGTPASQVFDLQNDTVLEIGLTPNRVDAASHYGTARDLKARLKRAICQPSIEEFDKLKKEINKTDAVQVEIANAEACPRYAGLTIKNVKVAASPAWLKMALESIGQKSINNVVDVTNYVLHSFGQPLHAFDADKIKGNKIVVSTLKNKTEFVALDKDTYKLAESDLMICDSELNPLCIAGVFGGADSGVSDSTTNIFLESAYFSPDFVRKTSKIHDLFTDASFRFARGTDPNNVLYSLKYAALLIQEIAGTEKTIFSEVTDLYPQKIENPTFEVSYNYLNTLIGNDISKETVKRILTDLDIVVSNENDDKITVSVPTYRVDVLQPADIAEEVLRIYGLNNIDFPQTAATDYIAPSISKDQEIRKKTADILLGMGFSEMMNNSLTSSNYAKALEIESTSVRILNPLSEDLDVMRQSLLFGGLESITRNLNRQEELIKGFEFGKVYSKIEEPKDDEHKYFEEWQLGLFLVGQTPVSWNKKATPVDYFQLSSVVQRVLKAVGFDISDFEQNKLSNDKELQYGIELTKRTGKDSFEQILKMGLVKKKLCKLTETNAEVFYAQIRWEALLNQKTKPREFSTLSKFPVVRRDLSIVLDKKVSFAELEKVAQKTERKILQNVSVFDIYEGDKIEEGKKSYSVAFSLQDKDKTLDEKTIEKTMQRLIEAYEKEVGALIRK